jgi:mono/diheme cytochrome c family protein
MVRAKTFQQENTVRAFVWGFILGALAVPAVGYWYFTSGHAPVATSDPDMPFEKMLAHKALDARVQKEMPKSVPIQADEVNLLAGVALYRDHCGVCHGIPGEPKTAIATGMYPNPPKLLEGKGVTDDEPGESYWKVANGIRLSGMPAFRTTLSETQMWQASLLVAKADKLPKSVTDALAAPVPAPPMEQGTTKRR